MIIDNEIKKTEQSPIEPANYPNIGQAVRLGWYFLLFSIAAGLPGGIIKEAFHINSKLINSLFTLLGYVLATVWTIWFGFKKSKQFEGVDLKLKLRKPPIIPVLVAVLMIMTMPVLTDPVSVVIPMPDAWKKLFDDLFTINVFSLVAVVIAAPILEEVIFRGIILNGLLKSYPPQKAIVVSAAIFAVIHMNPWQAIPAFLGGLLMGWMYWKTNSIIPGIIMHFFNNAFSITLGILFPTVDTLKQLLSTPVYVGLFLACMAILIGGWMFLEKYFEDNPTPEDDEEFEPELVEIAEE